MFSKVDGFQTFFWLSIFVGLLTILFFLKSILMPFLLALIIGYACNPGVKWLIKKKVSKAIAVLIMMVLIFVIVISIILIIIPIFNTDVQLIKNGIPTLIEKSENLITIIQKNLNTSIDLENIKIKEILLENLSSFDVIGSTVLNWLQISGISILGWFGTLFLLPIVLFYTLYEWDNIISFINNQIPKRFKKKINIIFSEIDKLLGQYLRGQVLVMFVLSMYYSFALKLIDFELALPVGILSGLLIIIPYLGFIFGLFLAIFASLLQFEGFSGIVFVFLIYGLGQILESFYLTPKLIGERIGLHPLSVIFALLAFGHFFGFTGVLLALPISAVISVCLKHLKKFYIESSFYNKL